MMPRIAPRPVLLVAGGGFPDEIPASRLYRDAGGATVQLWELPGTIHTAGLRKHPAAYERRTVWFPGPGAAAWARASRTAAAAAVAAAGQRPSARPHACRSHSRQIQRVESPASRASLRRTALSSARAARRSRSSRSAG